MEREGSNIAAADFVRHFPKFRSLSARHPVFITSYGTPTNVLMSIELYEQIGQGSGNRGTPSDDRYVRMLAEWIDDGMVICDSELRVTMINRVAQGMVGRAADEVEGKLLQAAFPEIKASVFESYAKRSAISKAINAAEIPSPFQPRRWIGFQSFPLGDNIVFKLRDITEDMQAHRLANMKEALLTAFEVNGEIGYVRLSPRGTIERVDEPFAELIGIPWERLTGVSLADLIDLPERAAFREALEDVLSNLVPARTRAGFLTNAGQVIEMNVAMVALVGSYGCEGVVTVLTKADS